MLLRSQSRLMSIWMLNNKQHIITYDRLHRTCTWSLVLLFLFSLLSLPLYRAHKIIYNNKKHLFDNGGKRYGQVTEWVCSCLRALYHKYWMSSVMQVPMYLKKERNWTVLGAKEGGALIIETANSFLFDMLAHTTYSFNAIVEEL